MDDYLERPGARIAYSSSSPSDAAPPLVVAHSLATSRGWEDEAGIFDWSEVARSGHRLVRFDTRGHGASTGGPQTEQYRWRSLADDLLAVADAVSPEQPVDGLGESTGCGVLLWAALEAPERFRRLLLVIPPTTGEARAQQAELYIAAADLIELRGADAWQRLTTSAAPAPILRRGGWVRPDWVPIEDRLLPSVLRGAAESRFPADEALRTIDLPTLILAWDTDLSHPLDTAEHLARALPRAELQVATEPEQVRAWGTRAADFLRAP